jgi:ribosomal protein S18 acetylase RimI-like enzyme
MVSRAFFDDPMFAWVESNESRRRSALPGFFRLIIQYCLRYGEVYSARDDKGVALWLTPGNSTITIGRIIKSGMWKTPFYFSMQGIFRFMILDTFSEKLHKRIAPAHHWYLLLLGVDPDSQGKGIGMELVLPILKQCDRDDLSCYLETNKFENLQFYNKFGFTSIENGFASKTSPQLWALLRTPESSHSSI